MTNLVLMIMPLVGGYWFLSNCNRTKYMAYGYTGYRLFFGSAFFGIVFLICAKLILSTMSAISTINYITGCISEWLIPTGFNLESTLAMIIGIASPYMFYSSIYKDNGRFASGNGRNVPRRIEVIFCKFGFLRQILRVSL